MSKKWVAYCVDQDQKFHYLAENGEPTNERVTGAVIAGKQHVAEANAMNRVRLWTQQTGIEPVKYGIEPYQPKVDDKSARGLF